MALKRAFFFVFLHSVLIANYLALILKKLNNNYGRRYIT